ncbi:MAG: RluA family pseudouridine synthase [bacterium]
MDINPHTNCSDKKNVLSSDGFGVGVKVLHESKSYLVISKPIGIAVHPGADRNSFTIRDWLMQKYPGIEKLAWHSQDRVGIVHRLDKDTSGIMILAKTPEALDFFQDQFRERKVEKYYKTLVFGKLPQEHGFIDAFLSRDYKNRKKQKAESIDFELDWRERKNSATEYWVEKHYTLKKQSLSLLLVRIYTGRKHQIRVHMKFKGCPVIGDETYFIKPSKRVSKELGINRQFLHSVKLKIKDFDTKKFIEFIDELPADLEEILKKIDAKKLK